MTRARLRRAAIGAVALMSSVGAAAIEVPDTLAQRLLACTACHGKEGRAAPDGYYPRIAGKPAGYLYAQLLNFRDGRRRFAPMTALLDNLSDAYLREIADHFASLQAPHPAPRPATVPAAALARGRMLVEDGDPGLRIPACRECHGRSLTGTSPFIPGLLGLPRDYLNAQLGAWRAGQRRAASPDCMATIARRLSPADTGSVSAYLASLPVPIAPATGARSPQRPLECGSTVSVGSGRDAGSRAGGSPR